VKVAQIDYLVDVANISGVLDRAVHLDPSPPTSTMTTTLERASSSPFSASVPALNAINFHHRQIAILLSTRNSKTVSASLAHDCLFAILLNRNSVISASVRMIDVC
jgi:hypothetical protein